VARLYQLDQATQDQLRQAPPRTAREDVGFILRHPRLVGHVVKLGVRGALDALRSDPTLGWLKAADKVRRVAPDAILGAEWGGGETFMALVRRHAHHDDRCVEVGCGGGRITRLVRPLVSELVAMDVSKAMLDEAHIGGGEDVVYAVVEGFGNNLPSDAYSLAVSHDVFVHFDFDDVGLYLANLHRALRPGGRFIVSVCTLDNEAEREQYRRDVVAAAGHARRARMLPAAAYETLFEVMGFETLEAVRTPINEYANSRASGHLNYVVRRR
jgi:SAM-dependent methyltransferase